VEALLLGMLVAGFASGLHCAGMCGGLVTAFSTARAIRLDAASQTPQWLLQLLLSGGRIASYAAAGALAGALGAAGALFNALPVQSVLFVMANVLLLLTGIYIAASGRWLSRLETLGAPLWRVLQPSAQRLFGARTMPATFAAGVLWGCLPCGLVYGALAVAALTGSPGRGAATMLAFGLGTLPNLVLIGVVAARLRAWMRAPGARVAAGAIVLGFGTFGLARAEGLSATIRHALLCL
jgi:uncharacterized protein